MRTQIRAAVTAIVVLTIALGLAYPLLVLTGSQLVFPNAADGSLIEVDGKVVGSKLIGQDFSGNRRYFQSRPSQTDYAADATGFSNLGPNNSDLVAQLRINRDRYLKRERPFLPSLEPESIPPSAVMTSASGIDPHISPEDATIQAHRVSDLRNLSLTDVKSLIDSNTDSAALWIIGDPGVNVLELNLALDRISR